MKKTTRAILNGLTIAVLCSALAQAGQFKVVAAAPAAPGFGGVQARALKPVALSLTTTLGVPAALPGAAAALPAPNLI